MTGAVAEQRDDIRQLLQQLALASRNANATLAQTGELVRHANGLIKGPGNAAVESMQASMASLQRATANIDRLLDDNRDGLNNGMRGLSDIGPALVELRKTLESLQAISRKLDDNASGYLLGRDQAKEFKP
jgi:phospholipid/cholesterol/gamma-HCH transport system substrate-binding protein